MKRKKLSCIALLLLMFFAFGLVAEGVAMAAPIGEWKFDEGCGILTDDSSGQGKTGRLWGSTIEWVGGIWNKGLQFASSADYVQVPPSILELSNWSVTVYVKPTPNNSESYIYSERDSQNNLYFYISITSDNRIKVATWHEFRAGGWDVYETDPGKVTRDEWNHLVVTLENGTGAVAGNGRGTVKCSVDGRLVGQGNLGRCQLKKNLEPSGVVAGASWQVGTSSDLTRLGDAVEDFDALYPWGAIKQFEAFNGVNMVYIPKFYYKRTYDSVNKKHEIWIADKPTDGFKVHPAFRRDGVEKPFIYVGPGKFGAGQSLTSCKSTAQGYGTGFDIMDIQTWSAIQMLQLVEYANTSGSTNYRGINGLYSEAGQYVDGLISKNGEIWIGGSDTGFVLPDDKGYITDWHYSDTYDWLFLPKGDVRANADTHIASTFRRTTAETVAVGGCSWWHCDCSTYCNKCYINQHGYCSSGCSCRCGCSYCRNGNHYGCHYYGDGFCGRPPVGSLGLFSLSCRLSSVVSSPSVSARLLYVP